MGPELLAARAVECREDSLQAAERPRGHEPCLELGPALDCDRGGRGVVFLIRWDPGRAVQEVLKETRPTPDWILGEFSGSCVIAGPAWTG